MRPLHLLLSPKWAPYNTFSFLASGSFLFSLIYRFYKCAIFFCLRILELGGTCPNSYIFKLRKPRPKEDNDLPKITSLWWGKTASLGFPGGTVVKTLPANAGDTGLSPGPGRSHMPRSNWACAPQLLSLCSRAREPQLLSPHATTTEAHAPRARAPQREATAMRSLRATTKTSPPLAANRESSCAATKTQCSEK